MGRVVRKKLGELLIERGVISPEQLREALEIQRNEPRLLGEILMELGYVKEEDIVLALSTQYGFPYLPLDNYLIEEDVIKLVPPPIARHYMLVPVDKMGNLLTVAMVDPLDVAAVDAVKAATGLNVATFISTLSQVRSALDKYYPVG